MTLKEKVTPGTIVGKSMSSLALDELTEAEVKSYNAYVWSWGRNQYGELSLGIA